MYILSRMKPPRCTLTFGNKNHGFTGYGRHIGVQERDREGTGKCLWEKIEEIGGRRRKEHQVFVGVVY